MSLRSFTYAFAVTLLFALAPPASAQAMLLTGLPRGASPEFHAMALDGTPFDLVQERGRWVLVNFGASWCTPCVSSLAPLAAFQAAHPTLTVIAANVMESGPATSTYLQRYGSPSSGVWLTAAQAQPLHLIAIPVTWLLAPDGRIAGAWTGAFNAKNRALVEQALHTAGYAGAPTP